MKLKETVFFKENGKIYEGLVVGFEEEKVVVVPYEITEVRWGYPVINFKEKRILSKEELIFYKVNLKEGI